MMQSLGSGRESLNGSARLPQVVTPGSPPASQRGPSVGQRAFDRLRQRSALRATELRRERDERLNRRQMKTAEGAPMPKVATKEELDQVATLLHKRMHEILEDPGASPWYKLFNHIDDDGSGKISYFEFEDMVRNELKISSSSLTQDQVQAIWRALDEDGSGLISCGEFGHFMRKGMKPIGENAKTRMFKAKQQETSVLRQEQQQLLETWRTNTEADTAARREKAQSQYAFDWGLMKDTPRKKPPWKSPRAYIF
mmetsp:Transcript_53674/g.156451  ORF Transcript_53674/g.156451 Transcript_53674/m.156451 type:complete len:254 (-) Transcript_53674:70-831(-)